MTEIRYLSYPSNSTANLAKRPTITMPSKKPFADFNFFRLFKIYLKVQIQGINTTHHSNLSFCLYLTIVDWLQSFGPLYFGRVTLVSAFSFNARCAKFWKEFQIFVVFQDSRNLPGGGFNFFSILVELLAIWILKIEKSISAGINFIFHFDCSNHIFHGAGTFQIFNFVHYKNRKNKYIVVFS